MLVPIKIGNATMQRRKLGGNILHGIRDFGIPGCDMNDSVVSDSNRGFNTQLFQGRNTVRDGERVGVLRGVSPMGSDSEMQNHWSL